MTVLRLHLFTDGGARGNPGPAGIGGVLLNAASGVELDRFARFLGTRTNNQAEYEALLEALRRAKRLGATDVRCFLDSQLIVEQLAGRYKVKNAGLRSLHNQAAAALAAFSSSAVTHVPRERNREADRLVNQAIDEWRSSHQSGNP